MAFFRQRDSRVASPDFSLIFPAYNPGKRLTQTLRELDQFVKSGPDSWELVFVLDGCTDGSKDAVKNWRPVAGTSRRVVSYSPNRGKGYAVRQGLLAAQARHRIFTDVDLAYSFEDINRVAQELRRGSEVVIASRTHPESQLTILAKTLGYTFRRSIQSRVFSTIVKALLPLKQNDTQAGLKGFSERVVKEIVPRLACDGFGIDCELLTACVRFGLPITEIPVHVRYDEAGSTTNVQSTLRMIRELWRVRRAWPATMTPRAGQDAVRFREAG